MDAMKTFLKRWRSEEGAELVEFALVVPMLLLVVLGIAEFGFIFQRYEVLTNAAREGARMAVLPNYTTADVQARISAYVATAGVPTAGLSLPVVADVTIPVGGGRPPVNAKSVTVTYTHNYMFLGGIGAWFGSAYTTLPLTAVSAMRTELAPAGP